MKRVLLTVLALVTVVACQKDYYLEDLLNAEGQAAFYKNQTEMAHNEIKELQNTINSLTEDLNNEKAQVEDLLDRVTTLEDNVIQLENDLELSQDEITFLDEKVMLLSTNVIRLNDIIKAVNDVINGVDAKTESAETVDAELLAGAETIKDLQDLLDQLQSYLENLEALSTDHTALVEVLTITEYVTVEILVPSCNHDGVTAPTQTVQTFNVPSIPAPQVAASTEEVTETTTEVSGTLPAGSTVITDTPDVAGATYGDDDSIVEVNVTNNTETTAEGTTVTEVEIVYVDRVVTVFVEDPNAFAAGFDAGRIALMARLFPIRGQIGFPQGVSGNDAGYSFRFFGNGGSYTYEWNGDSSLTESSVLVPNRSDHTVLVVTDSNGNTTKFEGNRNGFIQSVTATHLTINIPITNVIVDETHVAETVSSSEQPPAEQVVAPTEGTTITINSLKPIFHPDVKGKFTGSDGILDSFAQGLWEYRVMGIAQEGTNSPNYLFYGNRVVEIVVPDDHGRITIQAWVDGDGDYASAWTYPEEDAQTVVSDLTEINVYAYVLYNEFSGKAETHIKFSFTKADMDEAYARALADGYTAAIN